MASKNLLINGVPMIWQRGTSFDSTTRPANKDATYLMDRWALLSDGDDVVDVTKETSALPAGAHAAMKFDVETANKKFGILQVLEGATAAPVIGGIASLSFKARISTGATISNLRASVLAWDGTEDSVTLDVVSAWSVAGTNPTLAANWTYENTPSNLSLTDSYQTFTIANVSIDTASAKNVAVFIWVDDTDATIGDFLYVADLQLEEGTSATAMERSFIGDELLRCRRYYQLGLLRYTVNAVAQGRERETSSLLTPPMRVPPAMGGNFSFQGLGGATTDHVTADAFNVKVQATTIGKVTLNYAWTATAEL